MTHLGLLGPLAAILSPILRLEAPEVLHQATSGWSATS
eukprot:CAMPEP_0185708920 /NCGR_PEP_ID=MMETSP1164-20130828/27576_1 /TAXON_ID=1104430 /ORGANISM="Chrysoreinhardia sp, Strain CCMP2950" /LENGTH=37 /DNA_ID= /DNA_START= /DNA_END= /DNA_ORIENTATION=